MKLRGAIIGLGNIAVRGHVPGYQWDPDVKSKTEIVAVMDVVGQNREKAQEHLPGVKFYSDLPSLLGNEKLDFVDICAPPHAHAEYLSAFAEQGIHIICEKPLAESHDAVIRVQEAIGRGKIVFVPCHQYKYAPLWKTIRDVITSGTLGEVSLAQFNVFRLHADSGTAAWNPEWRTNKKHSGGGILVDTGAHYFYLAQYFFGVPRRLSALLRTLKHKEYAVEDTALVTLDYGNTLMQINLTWAANRRANSVFIVGSKGTLSYDGRRLLQESSAGTKEIPMPDVSDKKQYVSWYGELFKEFLTRKENQNYSDDLLMEAVMVMKLLDLSYRGSEEHRMVNVV